MSRPITSIEQVIPDYRYTDLREGKFTVLDYTGKFYRVKYDERDRINLLSRAEIQHMIDGGFLAR